jgi:hypothetical protein
MNDWRGGRLVVSAAKGLFANSDFLENSDRVEVDPELIGIPPSLTYWQTIAPYR